MSKRKELAAFVCSHVFRQERSVLYVRHDLDGDWQFLCGYDDHPEDDVPKVIGINHVLEDDMTVISLRDLQPGWEAERDTRESDWVRQESND